MSTEPILSIGRCGEKKDLSATEDAPRIIRQLLDERTPEVLPLEQQAFSIHEKMPRPKKSYSAKSERKDSSYKFCSQYKRKLERDLS